MSSKFAQVLDKDLFCRRICSQYYVDDIGKLFNARLVTFVVLYADDILLLAPSVALLQNLLQQCEKELNLIDMAINTKKFTAACVLVQEMTMCVLN